MNKPTFKRIIAYLIDSIIITAIVTVFTSIDLINPYKEEYNNTYKEYQEYIISIDNPSDVLNSEYVNNITYDLSHFGIYSSIIGLVVTFSYFVIFQYYNNGKTIGKALLGIKVVSTNSEKLNLTQVIIRSAIINSLLTSSALILSILFLSKTAFINANLIIGYIDLALIFISIGMILFREDGAGLHDMLAHTLVVDSTYVEVVEKKVTKKQKILKQKKLLMKKRNQKEKLKVKMNNENRNSK